MTLSDWSDEWYQEHYVYRRDTDTNVVTRNGVTPDTNVIRYNVWRSY